MQLHLQATKIAYRRGMIVELEDSKRTLGSLQKVVRESAVYHQMVPHLAKIPHRLQCAMLVPCNERELSKKEQSAKEAVAVGIVGSMSAECRSGRGNVSRC